MPTPAQICQICLRGGMISNWSAVAQIGGSGVHLDAGAITSAAASLGNSGGRAAQGKMFGAASGTT